MRGLHLGAVIANFHRPDGQSHTTRYESHVRAAEHTALPDELINATEHRIGPHWTPVHMYVITNAPTWCNPHGKALLLGGVAIGGAVGGNANALSPCLLAGRLCVPPALD